MMVAAIRAGAEGLPAGCQASRGADGSTRIATNASSVASPVCIIDSDSAYLGQPGAREPRNWLPADVLSALAPSADGSVQLVDVTLRAPSCAALWALQQVECTFHAVASWPVAGLEAGPGYLFYPALAGTSSSALRLNVTCPPDDWAALAASPAPSAAPSPSPPLLPCGTAVVASGQALLAALAALQPTHARLLVTLAANISLPAAPTPLLADPDAEPAPLVAVYRNTTIAGYGSAAAPRGAAASAPRELQRATELDLRSRRSAFTVLQAAPDASGGGSSSSSSSSADGSGSGGGAHVMLTLADLALANIPPGPLSTWPAGFLSTDMWHVALDRSPAAPVQLLHLRLVYMFNTQVARYVSYWYGRMVSLVEEERRSSEWLAAYITPYEQVPTDDGSPTRRGATRSFLVKYNVTFSSDRLVAPRDPPEIDLWAAEDPPAPLGAFTLVWDANGLRAAMEGPGNGSRVVAVLLRNVTLDPDTWPQDGATLSVSATLSAATPSTPTYLALRGLPLARVPLGRRFSLRFLTLNNLAVPASWALPDAPPDLPGLPGYAEWRARCLPRFGDTVMGRMECHGVRVEVPPNAFALFLRVNGGSGCSLRSNGSVSCASPPPSAAGPASASWAALWPFFVTLYQANGQAQVWQPDARSLAVPANTMARMYMNSSLFVRVGGAGDPPSLAADDPAAAVPAPLSALGPEGMCSGQTLFGMLLASSTSPPPPSPAAPPNNNNTNSNTAATLDAAGSSGGSGGSGGMPAASIAAVCGAVGGAAVLAASVALAACARRRRRQGAAAPASDPEKGGATPARDADSATAPLAPHTQHDGGDIAGGGAATCPADCCGDRAGSDACGCGCGGRRGSSVALTLALPLPPGGSGLLGGTASFAALPGGDEGGGWPEVEEVSAFSTSFALASGLGMSGRPPPATMVEELSLLGRAFPQGQPAPRVPHAAALLPPLGSVHAHPHVAAATAGAGAGAGAGTAPGDSAPSGAAAAAAAGVASAAIGGGGAAWLPLPPLLTAGLGRTRSDAEHAAATVLDSAATPTHPAAAAAAAGRPASAPVTHVKPGSGGDGAVASPGASADVASTPGGGGGAAAAADGDCGLAGEINGMIRRFQATAAPAAAAPSPSGSSSTAARVLGSGGFGVVYKGEWRGLPAAIKVVLLQEGDPAVRRERLVREVALTVSLSHPHIVPTYHYTVDPIRNCATTSAAHPFVHGPGGDGGGPLGGPTPHARHAWGTAPLLPGVELRAFRLSIVMAYCDGGSLREALLGGAFRRPWHPPAQVAAAVAAQAAAAACGGGGGGGGCASGSGSASAGGSVLALGATLDEGCGVGCGVAGMHGGARTMSARGAAALGTAPGVGPWTTQAALLAAAAAAAADGPDSGGGGWCGGHVLGAMGDARPRAPAHARSGMAAAAAAGAAGAAAAAGFVGHEPRIESWRDLRAAGNLPLALMAALDVARGLAYLHACSVVHGDLSLQNILIASAEPCFGATALATALAAGLGSNDGPGAAAGGGGGGGFGSGAAGRGTAAGCPAGGGGGAAAGDEAAAAAATAAPSPLGRQMAAAVEVLEVASPPPPARMAAVADTDDASFVSLSPETSLSRLPSGAGMGHAGDEQQRNQDHQHQDHHHQHRRHDQQQQELLQLHDPQHHPPAAHRVLLLPGPPLVPAPATAATAAAALGLASCPLSDVMVTTQASACSPPDASAAISNDCSRSSTRGDTTGTGTGTGTGTCGTGSVGTGATGVWRAMGLQRPDAGATRAYSGAAGVGGAHAYGTPPASAASGGGGGGGGGSALALAAAAASLVPLLSQVFKISDFGLSVRLEGDETHRSGMYQGTPFYTPPEVLRSGQQSPAGDVHALGVCLWCLVHGVTVCQVRHLLPSMYVPAAPALLAATSPDLPPHLRALLRACLAAEPGRRPTAAMLVAELSAVLASVVGRQLAPLLLGAERHECDVRRRVSGLLRDSTGSTGLLHGHTAAAAAALR